MKHFFLFIFIALGISCGSSNSSTKTDSAETATSVDCLSPDVQKTLTYCASPEAADQAKRNFDTTTTVAVPLDSAPSLGSENPLVTVVVFTDLQCPYCKAGHVYVKNLMNDPDVKVVFRHAPLPFHPDAIPAAYGALAAGEQGKFWEYVDVAFENQKALTTEDLKKYATTVGLDVAKWESDFAKQSHQDLIAKDIELAQKTGVQGTPTFFVNGLRLAGLYPEEQFNGLIAEQKALATRLVDAGVPRSDLYRRFVGAQYTEPEQSEAYEEEAPQVRVAMVPVDGAPSKG